VPRSFYYGSPAEILIR
ncbi:unnamed protein product, partial [Allacma fusca]